jgi:radical SAM protein with 4Fe4S-binding SPASM domain
MGKQVVEVTEFSTALSQARVLLTDCAENSFSPDHCQPPKHAQCDCDCACSASSSQSPITLFRPVTCHLELTYACPNHCPGCGNVAVDRSAGRAFAPGLAVDQWARVLDQLEPSVHLVRITGGEPTHYPDFFPFLNLLASRGIGFALLTCGRWPDPELLLRTLRAQRDFRGFLISLHGPDAASHQAFTASPGSFADACQAIRAAAAAGFDVSANCVLVQPNLSRLQETAALALALGANQVIFGRHLGDPQPGLTLSSQELRLAMREVKRLEAAGWPVKFGNCIPHCYEASSSTGCSAGQTFCTVDPWGNVRPCNHARLVTGNLLNQPLEEIWWSEEMDGWRQFGAPACTECAAYALCHGGCRAMAWETGRDPLMRRPLAWLAQGSRQPLVLYAGAVPRSRYTVRQESFGPALLCDSRVTPVTSAALAFLQQVDGRCSLSQVEQDYGSAALAFLGQLFSEGFIDLATPR